ERVCGERAVDRMLAPVEVRPQRLDDAFDDIAKIEQLALQRDLAARDAADVEQIVDEPRQLARLPRDDLACPFGRGEIVRPKRRDVQRALDRREWIAELVREHR